MGRLSHGEVKQLPMGTQHGKERAGGVLVMKPNTIAFSGVSLSSHCQVDEGAGALGFRVVG
jgi:hypothetical protein